MAAGHGLAIPLLGLGALAGMLPDIDHPGSQVGRFFPWPSVEVQGKGTFVRTGRKWFGGRVIWHRGETHSVGATAIVMLLGGWLGFSAAPLLASASGIMAGWAWAGSHPLWLGGVVALAVGAGYLSHLVADLINPSKQMWAWPFSHKMSRPRGLPSVKSGSWRGWVVETLIVALLMAGVWAEIGSNLL
jgi:inner membrane protein